MPAPWPEITPENRPWTRWWWMGSAYSFADITVALLSLQEAGVGGVEISPIYGVPGYEDRWVEWLSPSWMALLTHTLRETRRMGMGCDLILGNGWPFGGPMVDKNDAPQKIVWASVGDVPPFPDARLLAENDGLALYAVPTGQQVKRAAPGGAGHVLDHFSLSATQKYLAAFDAPLAALPTELTPRCFFNDSYEVFGANTTPDICAAFSRLRGYLLQNYLPALKGDSDAETVQRVRSDYRETIGDLLRDDFGKAWSDWTHGKNAQTRLQAHGSPGNLLDLYGLSDIPETEVFGPPRLKLGGMTALRPVSADFDEGEELLICKFASSAAHVMGRPLCSSESFTWAGEHGCVPLEHAKAEADTLFAIGINHIFFHGTPFSPPDVPWPGWLFYATTHFAPTNSWWCDVPAFNLYLARCQSLLQAGVPDADVLLYFPHYDLLASEPGAHDSLQMMTVGRTETWLRGNLPGFTQTARDLWNGGWGYDLVSDRQLQNAVQTENGELTAVSGGASWRVLLVAGGDRMPPETMERLAELAQSGVTVLVLGELPNDVPGLSALPDRRERLQVARETLRTSSRVFVGDSLTDLMARAKVPPEVLSRHGLEWNRRKNPDTGERTYFVANPGTGDVDAWLSFAHLQNNVTLFDPMTGDAGVGTVRTGDVGQTEVRVVVPAGASLLVRGGEIGDGSPSAFPAAAPDKSHRQTLTGPWDVAFTNGGPTLPAPRQITALSSWTTWPDADEDALRAFSGTASYHTTFDTDFASDVPTFLDLGEVCHSVRVLLNGRDLGTVFARPWRVRIPADGLLPTGNVLHLHVTNLMANRLADRERKDGKAWRPFFLVDIRYKPFENAADWPPLPSGLIGPVRISPSPLPQVTPA